MHIKLKYSIAALTFDNNEKKLAFDYAVALGKCVSENMLKRGCQTKTICRAKVASKLKKLF